MKNTKLKKHYRFERILGCFSPSDNAFVCRALDLDIIGTGSTYAQATASLHSEIKNYMDFCVEKNYTEEEAFFRSSNYYQKIYDSLTEEFNNSKVEEFLLNPKPEHSFFNGRVAAYG